MTFQFNSDGQSEVYWERTGEVGFCHRKGLFSIQHEQSSDYLVEEVTWVNPKNESDCGSDPDMQVGKKSFNLIQLKEGHFYLEVGLADEAFAYVFQMLELN